VGRILRQKHSSPLVIDIIDGHDIFMSQWYKRRKYYKSQDYKILVCDNTEYDTQDFKNDLAKWKVSWAPKGESAGAGVSKKTQATKSKVVALAPTKTNAIKVKSIAEKLNIKINVKGGMAKKGKNSDDEDDEDDDNYECSSDDDNKEVDERTYSDSGDDESSMHEKKRKTTRGKSGLAGKGCLIDITKL
jgi:hypothetical protein